MKTKNDDLFGLTEVCGFFGLSESTIRRKVRSSRAGDGNFPLPLFGSGCRVLWRKVDILNWTGESGEVIRYDATPPLTQPVIRCSTAQADR